MIDRDARLAIGGLDRLGPQERSLDRSALSSFRTKPFVATL
jgi:hypothetical protein